MPRYTPTTTALLGPPFEILDAESFLIMREEILEQAIYDFDTETPEPYILDGGANIGVSIFAFKRAYPRARIVAFEPDQKAFDLLQRNVERAGLRDVTLVRAALAASDSTATFQEEGSWAGRLARNGDEATASVPTVRLRPYLERDVDLLKLNIEGAETDVIGDCADRLGRVRRVVLEYHSFKQEPQTLHRLLGHLAAAGFRVYVRSLDSGWPRQPFRGVPVHEGMDLQLYVWAWRDPSPMDSRERENV
jgi:FkbM family methyltransferase